MITGTITVNGEVPKDMRVMLFYDEGYPLVKEKDRNNAVDYPLAIKTVDNCVPGKNGRFSFDRLGEGKYTILVVTAQGNMSSDMPSDRIRIRNNPGLIDMDKKKPLLTWERLIL